MASPQTASDEGDEPRGDSEAGLQKDPPAAEQEVSGKDDDQEDDESRLTAEAMESMTVGSVACFVYTFQLLEQND